MFCYVERVVVKVRMRLVLAMLLLGAPWYAAHASGVDCRKPATKIDQLVCGSQPLLNLDTKYAQAYRLALDSVEDRNQFIKLAKSDLKWRAENCSDAICVEEWYENVTPRYLAFAANAKLEKAPSSGGQSVPRSNDKAPAARAVNGPAFTPKVRQVTQQYARAVNECMYSPYPAVARKACSQVEVYAKKLKATGWEARLAARHIFDLCNRVASAYEQAAGARDITLPPGLILTQLKASQWLRIDEPELKSIINTAYFQDRAVRLAPAELANVMEMDCRYGPDPKWQPLK